MTPITTENKTTFSAYLEKLSAKLQEYKAWLADDKVDEMKAKLKAQKANLEIEFSEEIAHAKELEEQMEAKVEAAKDAAEDQQENLKADFNKLIAELQHTWDHISASVKNAS